MNSLHTLDVFSDGDAPVINLISPADKSISEKEVWNFSYTVNDYSTTNCTLYIDRKISDFNPSVNISGGKNYFSSAVSIGAHTAS